MIPTRPLVIHKSLPNEIMGVIFEEHTKLDWRAPAIDGRVCRIWRQIVLNTPRAWTYLEIGTDQLTKRRLREWLHRSGSAPLHIRVIRELTCLILDDLLRGYHTRIASLRLPLGDSFLFEGRDFPYLRLLEVNRWDPRDAPSMRWRSMPELQSLRLVATETFSLQWSELPQLEVLILYSTKLTSSPQHPQSLTTLMLDKVSVQDAISSPIDFPSLTYLSVYFVTGLKPYINAPRLVTYHDSGREEPFPSPIPSLVEYGAYFPSFEDVNLARWHHAFPNASRLSIRSYSIDLIKFFRSLSRDPNSLPALQTISVGASGSEQFTEESQETMRSLVRVRGEVCRMDVILYFETKPPFHIPIFLGEVSHCHKMIVSV